MSVSKWAYEPKKCNGDYCPGDCDNCQKKDEDEEEIRKQIWKEWYEDSNIENI